LKVIFCSTFCREELIDVAPSVPVVHLHTP